MPDPLLALQRRFEVNGLYRRGDRRQIVVVAHADRHAVAGRDRHASIADNDRPPPRNHDPVLVAVVIVRIDRRGLRIVDRVADIGGVVLVGSGENAASTEFVAPVAGKADEGGAAGPGTNLPSIVDDVEKLPVAKNQGGAGETELKVAGRDDQALLAGAAALGDDLARECRNDVEGFQLAPRRRSLSLAKYRYARAPRPRSRPNDNRIIPPETQVS